MKQDFTNDILSFVKREKEQIEDATFDLRQQLRRARRNYEGKFDEPVDLVTGKRKVFYPLTQQEVDAVTPRFDMDPNSISVKTEEPGLDRKSLIWEELLKHQFRDMEWRTRTKELMTPFVNEGTIAIELFWDSEKQRPDFYSHELKNVFIFPQEPSFEAASMFAVRRRTLLELFMLDDRYMNKEDVSGFTEIQDRGLGNDRTLQYDIGKYGYTTALENVELYERHGWFPKSYVTGYEKDSEELVDGTITVANIDKNPVLVEVTENGRRMNFIEAWYNKRPYVWYGRGIGLALRDYQFLLNKIVNRRDDNEDVLHRGMFVKRRGMNIDARQRFTGSGIWIEADDPASITQLRTTDITQGSYVGESNILSGVQRLNGTYAIALGGGSAQSASEAALKDRNAGTRLNNPQAYLDRLFIKAANVVMEMDKENLPKNKVVKFTGRDEMLATFDDFQLSEVNSARSDEGLPPISKEEFASAMKKFKGDRYIQIPNMNFLKGEFHPEIDTDASLLKNKAGAADQILGAMKIAAQIPQVTQEIDFSDLFEKWLNLNGLKAKRVEPGTGFTPENTGGVSGAPSQGQQQQEAIKQMLAQAGAPTLASKMQ